MISLKNLRVIIILVFLIMNCCSLVAQKSREKIGVKWHPGHYILVNDKSTKQDYLKGSFLGIQRKYNWKEMELAKGKYDFSQIQEDLTFLQKHGKRLVIQIQTKGFGEDVTNTPNYLKDKEYGGSLYKTATGSYNPVYWNEKVSERIEALYIALGKQFDEEPYIEAMVIPETAISSDIKNTDQLGVEHYTPEIYGQALERQMKVLKDAFPHTVVIQYTNFPKEVLQHIINYQKSIGVGLGGPDINLYSNLNDPKTGVYRYYDEVKDSIALGSAVQSEDYSYDNPRLPVKIPSLPTMKEIFLFARDRLHLNYMFWLNRPKYFNKVLDFMKSDDFPKDSAGGLNSKLPACYR